MRTYKKADYPVRRFLTKSMLFPFFISIISFSNHSSGHSGRTNSEGCHNGSRPYHCHKPKTTNFEAVVPEDTKFDRDDYGTWSDLDGDCKSTRHEILEQLNIGQLSYSANGCRVVSGRWFGVFSGQYFYNAHEMDIDHVFPVSLADRLGARNWPSAKKRQFFNDPANLLPVDKSLNRSKGAKDPTQWLPPNIAYRCEYVTRFLRVGTVYGLISDDYRSKIDQIHANVCASSN